MSDLLPNELRAAFAKDANKTAAKAVNKEMRLILKDYGFLVGNYKKGGHNAYYAMERGLRYRLQDAYRDSINFKHMNARSVLLFIQLNNTLRAVPFHQVFVNKDLLS